MIRSEQGLQRRVAGYHDIRLDGMTDLVTRARDSVVMDLGCNRGMVSFEFANNGARVVHGCDVYEEGIRTAQNIFADIRNVRSQFEVVDLTKGPAALSVFGGTHYDITVMLATYHKLKRLMEPAKLSALISFLGNITRGYFAWRGTTDQTVDNDEEMFALDRDLHAAGMARVHTSYLSRTLGVAAIWEKR